MTKDIDTIKLRGNDPKKSTRSLWDGEFIDILLKYRSQIDSGLEEAKKVDVEEVKIPSESPIKPAEPDIESKTGTVPKNVLSAMEALRRIKSSQSGLEVEPITDENSIIKTELPRAVKIETTSAEASEVSREPDKNPELPDEHAYNSESIEKVKQRYMVGKIVGEDILDSRGNVIVKRHELITMEIIDRVEKAGKIVDLVVNMQFPD